MKRFTPTFYAITLVTLAAAGVFAVALTQAAVFVPDGPGAMPGVDAGGVIVSGSSSPSPRSSSNAVSSESDMTPPDHPARLVISSLGIDAAVQNVGVTGKGSVGTPNNFTSVGWYVYGAVPGEAGTALIDGHVDNGLGLAGVFKHLEDIEPGADVVVVTHGGSSLHFTVKSVVWYDYKDTPADALFARTSSSDLVLVTCGGSWVPIDRTYDRRLVVTASLDENPAG